VVERVEAIADDDMLYRRLASHCIRPGDTVSSAAFKTRNQWDREISVDLARLTTPARAFAPVAHRPGFKLGRIVAGVPRALGFEVRHDPRPDNEAHTLIVGDNSEALSRRLARAVTIVADEELAEQPRA
jgi:hypothetical protein